MIEVVRKEEEKFLSHLGELHNRLAKQGPLWLQEMRRAAYSHFVNIGFPSTRDEEWKYTNVRPIARTAFEPAPGTPRQVSRQDLDQIQFAHLKCPRLVFVDGYFSQELSSVTDLPEGVKAGSLAELLESDPEAVEPHLGRYADYQEHAFSALNAAFMQDGAYVRISRGQIVEEPIHLLFFADSENVALFPRVLVLAEDNTQARIVETHLGKKDIAYLSNSVAEIVAGQNAVLDHYKLQFESKRAYHIATQRSQQGRDSQFRTQLITLGARLARNNINGVLNGEGADCCLNGMYLVKGEQHVDNHTRLDHAKPHCSSRELYKGILDDKATGVFHGRIVVYKDAQKTDSKQTNNNLLLSDEALINTQPQLEIYADDVKCTHGATIGQLDENAIFYLRSRGIGERTAYSLLIYAFASQVVGKIRVEALRNELNEYLFDWLPRGELVREAV
ncbi:MAG: Fe-S cluster assembly protein SufD [Acidobacteriota bacterium]